MDYPKGDPRELNPPTWHDLAAAVMWVVIAFALELAF